MKVKILQEIPRTDGVVYREGVIVHLTREYAKELIAQGLAEPTDEKTALDLAVKEQVQRDDEDVIDINEES